MKLQYHLILIALLYGLFFENYFQINSFAQMERKKINIQDLKFDDLEEVCTKETVLIKKEYFSIVFLR